MMKAYVVVGVLTSILSFSCAQKKPKKMKSPVSKKDNITAVSGQESKKPNFGSMDDEFSRFQAVTKEYKETPAFKTPKTDEEKELRVLAEGASNFTKEKATELITEEKIDKFDARIADYKKTMEVANKVVAPKEEGGEETKTEEGEEEGRTEAQFGAGVFLTVIGTLGVMLSSVGVKRASEIRRFLGINKDVIKRGSKAWGLIAGAFPLIVGAIIVADEDVDSAAIAAAQTSLGIGGVITTLGALGGARVAVEGSKVIKELEGGNAEAKAAKISRTKRFRAAVRGGSILAAGTAAGLFYAIHAIELTDSMTPKERLITGAARFYHYLRYAQHNK